MRSDRELAALDAMLEHAEDALSFITEHDEASFAQDRRTFLAVTRCLEIVSEASRRLSEGTRNAHPEIPWSEIRDAGNVYRHGYDVLSVDRIWLTVSRSLPQIVAFAQAELARRED